MREVLAVLIVGAVLGMVAACVAVELAEHGGARGGEHRDGNDNGQ